MEPTKPRVIYGLLLQNLTISLKEAESKYVPDPDDQNKWPPKKYFRGCDYLEDQQRRLEVACAAANHDAGTAALREWFAKLDKDISHLKGLHADQLFVEEADKWPKKWMIRKLPKEKENPIHARLGKTRFYDVMNYLWRSATWAVTVGLSQFLPVKKRSVPGPAPPDFVGEYPDPKRDLVLLTVDVRDMAEKLHMSVSAAQKYIQGFATLKIIKEVGRTPGQNGRKIYAIGIWLKWAEWFHRNPFLIDTPEWRKALREFRIP